MRVICLSVHSDDAAFSVGLILKRLSVESKQLWTLFSRSRWGWGKRQGDECTAVRAAEDTAFAQLIGADVLSLGLGDFTLMGAPTPLRRRNLRATLRTILERADREADLILMPIGVSTHPDHLLVREVLGGLLQERTEPGAWVFYEDLPYAVHHPSREARDTLSSWGLKTRRLAVPGSWKEKRKLIDSYPSQLTQEIVRDLQQTKGCERIYLTHSIKGVSQLSFLRALKNRSTVRPK